MDCAFHLRHGVSKTAIRIIDGTPMCRDCYAGKPINLTQEIGYATREHDLKIELQWRSIIESGPRNRGSRVKRGFLTWSEGKGKNYGAS